MSWTRSLDRISNICTINTIFTTAFTQNVKHSWGIFYNKIWNTLQYITITVWKWAELFQMLLVLVLDEKNPPKLHRENITWLTAAIILEMVQKAECGRKFRFPSGQGRLVHLSIQALRLSRVSGLRGFNGPKFDQAVDGGRRRSCSIIVWILIHKWVQAWDLER